MAAGHAYADAFAGIKTIDTVHSTAHVRGRSGAIAAMVFRGTPHSVAVAYVDSHTARWRANLRADRADRAAWLRGDL